jgi:hypothetical protein
MSLTEFEHNASYCERCLGMMRTKHMAAVANTPSDYVEAQRSLEQFRNLPEPPYAHGMWRVLQGDLW